MEIVIKIEDYDREWIANGYYIPDEINEKIAKTIIDGTPLPKGHGRLIDADCFNTGCGIRACDCVGDCDKCSDCVVSYNDIKNAETIIEADKENDNETDN